MMNKQTVKKLRKQLRKAKRPIIVEAPHFPTAPTQCFSYAGRMFHHRVVSDGGDEFYTTYPDQEDCVQCVRKHTALRNHMQEMENAFLWGVAYEYGSTSTRNLTSGRVMH